MNYSVKYGQTIYDIALNTYGSSEYVYKLISENPFVTSIDYDFDENPGAVIVWDETFSPPPPPETDRSSDVVKVDEDFIVAEFGQSIYDICLMTYGNIELIYKLIQDNNIVSLNNTDLSGKKFIFTPSLTIDKGFFNYLVNNNKAIATVGVGDNGGKSYNDSFNISFN